MIAGDRCLSKNGAISPLPVILSQCHQLRGFSNAQDQRKALRPSIIAKSHTVMKTQASSTATMTFPKPQPSSRSIDLNSAPATPNWRSAPGRRPMTERRCATATSCSRPVVDCRRSGCLTNFRSFLAYFGQAVTRPQFADGLSM